MEVQLYQNTSDSNYLTKSITLLHTIDCNIKQDTTIMNPQLLISALPLSELSKCNYCYIPSLGRYYFIDNINMGQGGISQVNCSVDVLMSFKSQFLSNRAIVQRQEDKYNLYLDDGSFMVYANNLMQTKEFPLGFGTIDGSLANSHSYIVEILGGAS